MEQIIVVVLVVAAGVLTWNATGSVLFTILAVIVAGFVGTFISFLIHQSRRKRQMGFSSMRELNEFDRDVNEIRAAAAPGIEEELAKLEEEARREGYASLSDKNVAKMREKARAYREANGQNE